MMAEARQRRELLTIRHLVRSSRRRPCYTGDVSQEVAMRRALALIVLAGLCALEMGCRQGASTGDRTLIRPGQSHFEMTVTTDGTEAIPLWTFCSAEFHVAGE